MSGPSHLAAIEAAGHMKRPILQAIREKCIDCSGGSLLEVRLCPVVKCALWPYRAGSDPFARPRGRGATEKNRPV
jgi:hypothetical protein